jgi:hypothetical protein
MKKKTRTALAALALLPLAARPEAPPERFAPPPLPPAVFADGEVSLDIPLPARLTAGSPAETRTFQLRLAFESSPSNNVQVAFGLDNAPADSALSAKETAFILGWDCGQWFIRPRGLRERPAFTPAASSGSRTLTLTLRLDASGIPTAAAFTDGKTAFTFAGLALSPPPEWLTPSGWDTLRVTARNAGNAASAVSVKNFPDGLTILIK